jgi:hypothetical protein
MYFLGLEEQGTTGQRQQQAREKEAGAMVNGLYRTSDTMTNTASERFVSERVVLFAYTE